MPMLHWKLALAAGLPAAAAFFVLLFVAYNWCRCRNISKHEQLGHGQGGNSHEKLSRLFSGLHLSRKDPLDSTLRNSSRVASVWRMTYPIKAFDWSEHTPLVTEAVEHGWGAFAFTYACSTCPLRNNFWDMCTSCSHKEEFEPEISWEIGATSEYMQKVWLNPGFMPKKGNYVSHAQAVQAALPLPGPPLGSHRFPQEAYFEITVMAEGREHSIDASQSSFAESELVKLISKYSLSGKNSSSSFPPVNVDTSGDRQEPSSKSIKSSETDVKISTNMDLSKFSVKDNPLGRDFDNLQVVAIGLAAGGAPPFRLPGCDAVSVGFHSNGRVYLNGVVHIDPESKVPANKRSWGAVKTTVGCGFNPLSRHVFFTIDGESVYELTTTSSDYGNPLYPMVAANYDVTLLVNFGQSPFEYAPANGQRVSDPCSRHTYSRSMKNGVIEDSGDLFSMGRIDSHWLTAGILSPGTEDMQHRHGMSEAESDLFEIVLDSRG